MEEGGPKLVGVDHVSDRLNVGKVAYRAALSKHVDDTVFSDVPALG